MIPNAKINTSNKIYEAKMTYDAKLRANQMGFSRGFPELVSFGVELAIVMIFGIGMPIFGFWLYQYAENVARRKGGLSKY
jgi:hypothetical protein